jgi:hypothetical protein
MVANHPTTPRWIVSLPDHPTIKGLITNDDRLRLCGAFINEPVELLAAHHAFMMVDWLGPYLPRYSHTELLAVLEHLIDYLGSLITTLQSKPPTLDELQRFIRRNRLNSLTAQERQEYYDETMPSGEKPGQNVMVKATVNRLTGEILNPVWLRFALIQIGGIKL